jgi:hypothetical protein|tara:strand:- start:8384 stop:8983 length:600 start_codon:yes stop_codon:yes gene_type:complete
MDTRKQEVLIQTILPIFSGLIFSFLIFFQFTYTNPLSQFFLGDVKRNQWIAHFDQSMKGQNPWLRNYVAFTGLLGSVRPEIIYLETMHDDLDTPLLGTNDYILKGTAPDCRYWSFVTYDFQNGRIEPHQQTIASSHRTKLNELGEYEIIITDDPEKYPNKQTIIHAGQDFNIVMRIYGPKPSYYETKNSVPVGSIFPLK